MATEQHSEKSTANARKPPADGRSRQPQQPPQIRSPLESDGPELPRDSHC